MMGIYWDLFFVFFKIGLFSFGGGLAMVNVVDSYFFGGISGSAAADTAGPSASDPGSA